MEDAAEVKRVQPARNRGGTWVPMGAEEYLIPPLAFGSIKYIQSNMATLQGIKDLPNEKQMDVVAEVVLLALQRNYPDMTLEQVRDNLDLGNFSRVFEAVLGSAGYRKSQPGEVQATSR